MSTDACQNVESAEENEVLRAWKLHMEQVKNQPENLNAELLWQMLCELQKIPFYTVKGIQFTYSIRGYEMFVDRKEKSITQATVLLSAQRVLEKQNQGIAITGPKKNRYFWSKLSVPDFPADWFDISRVISHLLYEEHSNKFTLTK